MSQINNLSLSDKISLWISHHYMFLFNFFIFLYLGTAFAAPIMMKIGMNTPAILIYRVYGLTCHQLAFRSWFLFGEQIAYPRTVANVEGWQSYEKRIALDSSDFITARAFIGNDSVGYKIALCQRDVAIYFGLLAFGLIFSITKNKLPPLPWFLWILVGVLPIGVDGITQIISQLPLGFIHAIIPFRESTPLLRTITGLLFGISTGWFAYPIVEISMRETREHLLDLHNIKILSITSE